MPDAVSGVAVRLSVNESPVAAVQLFEPDLKDAMRRFPPLIVIAPDASDSVRPVS